MDKYAGKIVKFLGALKRTLQVLKNPGQIWKKCFIFQSNEAMSREDIYILPGNWLLLVEQEVQIAQMSRVLIKPLTSSALLRLPP